MLSNMIENLHDGLLGETLVEIVVDLNHGRVGAGSEALDLEEREHAVRGNFSLSDADVLQYRLFDFLRTTDHAGRGAAELNEEFSHALSVEHGVERRDLVHLHVRDLTNLSDLFHHSQTAKVIVLALSQIQQRNDSALFEVLRIATQDRVHFFVVLSRADTWRSVRHVEFLTTSFRYESTSIYISSPVRLIFTCVLTNALPDEREFSPRRPDSLGNELARQQENQKRTSTVKSNG